MYDGRIHMATIGDGLVRLKTRMMAAIFYALNQAVSVRNIVV